MYEILQYVTPSGKKIYLDWLMGLRDVRAKLALVSRVRRIENGNFGDHKPCRDGVWELRIDVGAGYRLYYALAGKQVVLLLCGGNKGSQSADIQRAVEFWKQWQGEKNA